MQRRAMLALLLNGRLNIVVRTRRSNDELIFNEPSNESFDIFIISAVAHDYYRVQRRHWPLCAVDGHTLAMRNLNAITLQTINTNNKRFK